MMSDESLIVNGQASERDRSHAALSPWGPLMPIVVGAVEPGIVCVTIDNPKRRNALDLDMFHALAALWPRLADDASVRVVTIRGEGESAFCAGADLSAHLDRLPGIDDLVDRAFLKTAFFPKPLVASIVGGCVAGGLELALAADIRIAAEDAVLGLPEVRWGIMPSGGGAMKLADQIGLARAMDLLLAGATISGLEAERIGLVTQCCPRAETWSAALEKARLIAANSPVVVQAAKRAALSGRSRRYSELEPLERGLVSKVRRSGHPEEGKAAFLEKRRPAFPH